MQQKLLLDHAENAYRQAAQSSGKIILITGGPTCEDIDPVRYITNRSTGRMGIECALAARDLGLSPILILGPTHLEFNHSDIPLVNIRSAADLYLVLTYLFEKTTYLIMSAAVADFTPVTISSAKLKKHDIQNDNQEFILRLKRTRDILSELNRLSCRRNKFIAGFSLDTSINIDEGLRKLQSKGLDLIVINSTDAFEKSHSSITLITRDNAELKLSDNSKYDTGVLIIKELIRLESATAKG